MKHLTIFLLTFAAAWSQTQTVRIEGSVREEGGGSIPSATLMIRRIPETRSVGGPNQRGPSRIEVIGQRFERVLPVTSASRDFTISDVPPGTYLACVYTDDPAFVSNCEFEPVPQANYFSIAAATAGQSAPTPPRVDLTLKRSTVVDIVVNDPGRLISDAGYQFLPGIVSTAGHYKPAKLTFRSGTQHIYSVSIPRNETANVFIDTRLRVLDTTGKPVIQRTPSSFAVRGGPQRASVTFSVDTVDMQFTRRVANPQSAP